MDLVTITNPSSPISEAYRTLRTNLSFFSLDDPIRAMVVTSAEPNEDKSITLANLAVTMAQGGNRTILVDCDLRRPQLHTIFGLENEVGFTQMLLNDEAKLALQPTGVENLSVITSGAKPPNPADIVASKKVDALIERLKDEADIVLFAAPPVIAVSDAVVLGSKVDGVLLVLKAGTSRRDRAEKANQILQQAHVRVIGATLTNAPKEDSVADYYG